MDLQRGLQRRLLSNRRDQHRSVLSALGPLLCHLICQALWASTQITAEHLYANYLPYGTMWTAVTVTAPKTTTTTWNVNGIGKSGKWLFGRQQWFQPKSAAKSPASAAESLMAQPNHSHRSSCCLSNVQICPKKQPADQQWNWRAICGRVAAFCHRIDHLPRGICVRLSVGTEIPV